VDSPFATRTGKVLVFLAILWALTRAWPMAQSVPWIYWEVGVAKKLLEYGFLERAGAVLDIHFMTGHLPHPERFNYVNHPYPIHWLNTAIYAVGGGWGIMAFNAVLGLVTCWLVYFALRSFFPERQSFIGAALFTAAPSAIIFDINMNHSAQAAIIWPLGVWLVAKIRDGKLTAWWLGLAAFVVGQMSWSPFAVFPLLALGAMGLVWKKGDGFETDIHRPMLRALLVGALLTGAVFALQIVIYTPNWSEVFGYIRGQASSDYGVNTPRMLIGVAMRAALSLGPALELGALMGVWKVLRKQRTDWLRLSTLVFPAIFICCALLLQRYFYREHHLYEYLLFPMTVLALEGWGNLRSKAGKALIVLLVLAGIAYPHIRASVPLVSRTVVQMAEALCTMSSPDETILTNGRPQQPPYATWDVGGEINTAYLADRIFRMGMDSAGKMESERDRFGQDQLPIIFLWNPSEPCGDEVRGLLESASPGMVLRIQRPGESTGLATKLRTAYWKLIGKYRTEGIADAPPVSELRAYRLLITKEHPVMLLPWNPLN